MYCNVVEPVYSKDAFPLSRKEVFELVRNNFKDNAKIFNNIEEHVSNVLGRPYSIPSNVKNDMKKWISNLRKKWNEAHRTLNTFYNNNANWLNAKGIIIGNTEEDSETSKDFDRLSTSFAEASNRTKRRRTESIRVKHSTEELALATQMSLRSSGKVAAAKVMQDVIEGSPSKASKYRASLDFVCEDTLSPAY